jgi:hypothetical protein
MTEIPKSDLPKGITVNGKYKSAVLNLDYLTNEEFWAGIDWLRANGYEFTGRDYSLGYYDSVEDVSLEFNKKKTKKQ